MKHLFTALLLLCCLTATAHDFEVGGIYYNITDATNKKVEVTCISRSGNDWFYNDYTGSVVIPQNVTYGGVTYSVTSIGDNAFHDCYGLTSVEIPNSVTSIGSSAFAYCYDLTSVKIPNSVTSIGSTAFYECSGLTSITIPNSVTSIGNWAFENCKGLTSVVIGNSVTSIGEGAFENCKGLTSVVIGNSVTSIGDYAFNGCNGLTNIEIPNSVTSIGEEAFRGTAWFNNQPVGVVYAGKVLYEYKGTMPSNTSITIKDGTLSIASSAFFGCTGLTSIVIPNSVTSIGSQAFDYCSGLTSVIVNGNNTKYDSRENCNAIIETKTNTLISGCKNTVIPNSLTSIGNGAFRGCSGLTSIEIPNSVTSIGNDAFFGCTGLTSIEIPNSVTSIGDYAFYKCTGLTSVVIPNSVTSIGWSAFSGCTGLTSVEFNAENCTTSSDHVFNGCTALSTVIIGGNVKNIPYYAFRGCIGLTNIVVDGNNTKCDSRENCNAIIETETNTLILGCKNTVIPNSVTSIGGSAFRDCTGLRSIEIPNSVTSIEWSAFYGCTGLRSIEIPNSVTSIGDEAFEGCTGLISVEFNAENCTYMGDSDYPVFSGCTALSTVTIGENVKNIPEHAFYGCTGLTRVEYNAENCTTMGSYNYPVFSDCTALSTIIIGENVKNIPNYAFYGCTGLTRVEYNAENCTTMGSSSYPVFRDCTALSTVTIGENVKNIPDYAFSGCSGLTSIEIPNSVTSIGKEAFYACSKLKTIINFSNLTFSKGSSSNGYVAYYAKKVYNAPNGFINGDFIWFENENGMTLAGYLGDATELTLPTEYNEKSVTSIGSSAFDDCKGLTSIEIPNSVTSIGDNAFYGCSELKTIINFSNLTFSKGSSSNGYVAYYAKKVYNAPNGFIDGDFIWFENENGMTLAGYLGDATELTLPTEYNEKSVTSIGSSAFDDCKGLTSIEIPNSVTSIGDNAFYGCSELKTIINFSNLTFSKGSSTYGEIAFYADKVYNVPNGYVDDDYIWTEINNIKTLAYYLGSAAELILPADCKGENYAIGSSAFSACSDITSVVIPNSVTKIGREAFYGCSGLTSVEIPNSVTSIGGSAFYECKGLEKVHINDVAVWCGINFANVSANPLHYAGNLYLNGELLTKLVVPEGVAAIKNHAFIGCSSLTSVVIPNSVTSIGSSAFKDCTDLKTIINFSNLTFSKGGSSYGYVAYYATKVINAPNAAIDDNFIWCKLNGVNTLAYYFGEVSELTLPGNYNGKNYVIGNDAFFGCTGLTSIEIPNSVTSIGEEAFCNCSNLKSVTIPNSVTSVGEDAFAGCSNVEKLNLDCAEVGDWFSGVSAMKEVTIGNGVTSVVASAFNGCNGLEKVCINDLAVWCGIDFADEYANPLYYAKNMYLNGELLTELSIPAEVAEVKDYAFYNCNGVTNIDIVDGVKSIGNSAFYGCSNLETLYISNAIESIGDYAFAECNNIFDIKIGSKKVITASENIFSSDAYNNACLYVPTGRKDFYAKTSPWSNFIIREMDFTGIDDMEAEGERVKDVYYDLSGRVVENPSSGIYIINGKKVVIK